MNSRLTSSPNRCPVWVPANSATACAVASSTPRRWASGGRRCPPGWGELRHRGPCRNRCTVAGRRRLPSTSSSLLLDERRHVHLLVLPLDRLVEGVIAGPDLKAVRLGIVQRPRPDRPAG